MTTEKRDRGRPPRVEGEATTGMTIRLTDAERDKLDRLGGSDWLRRCIALASIEDDRSDR